MSTIDAAAFTVSPGTVADTVNTESEIVLPKACPNLAPFRKVAKAHARSLDPSQAAARDATVNLGLLVGILVGFTFAERSWGPFWIGWILGGSAVLVFSTLLMMLSQRLGIKS